MSEEEIIKDIVEILELAKDEIESNNENITATLDLQDLKSLKNLYDLYNKEKALNEELQIRYKIENDKYNKEKEKNKKIEDKIQEIIELQEKSNKDLVVLPNNECICLSDCCELIDYLKEILE